MTLLQFGLGPLQQQNSPGNDGSNFKGGGTGGGGGGSGGGSSSGNGQPNPPSSPNDMRESRGRSVGVGPMRRPADRKIDTSPYNSGNTAYLSPPSDPGWRRTSSDSAIHQSLIQNQDHHHHLHNHHHHNSHSPLTHSPTAQRRNHNHHSITSNINNFSNDQRNHNSMGTPDGRPRSSCGLSRPPGIK